MGFRNVEKALLSALCTPHTVLKELQDTNQFTELMVRQEELKTLPFGEIWDEYCRRNGVPVDGVWFEEVKKYVFLLHSKTGILSDTAKWYHRMPVLLYVSRNSMGVFPVTC